MADPISIAANIIAIISLAELGCKSIKCLHGIILDLKNASQQTRDLLSELEGLSTVLANVQTFAQILNDKSQDPEILPHLVAPLATLKSEIQGCNRILELLQKQLDEVTKYAGNAKAKYYWKLVLWALRKKGISQLIRQLGRHERNISITLQVSHGYTGLYLVSKVQSLEDTNKHAQSVSGTSHQVLEAAAQQSAHEVDKCLQSLTKLLESHDKRLPALKDKLGEIVASLRITENAENKSHFTLEGENLQAIVYPLSTLRPALEKLLPSMVDDSHMRLSKQEVQWIQEEFNSLLSSAHAAASSLFSDQKTLANQKWQLPDDKVVGTGSKRRHSHHENEDHCHPQKRHKLQTRVRSKRYATPMGSLFIKMDRDNGGGGLKLSFAYSPKADMLEVCRTGFVAILHRATHGFSIGRYLSTFSVVHWEGSGFVAITQGDLGQLKNLFSTQKACPSDRDVYHNTLIGWAAILGKPEICKFLLEIGGSDPCEENLDGKNAFQMYLQRLSADFDFPGDSLEDVRGILGSFVDRGCLDQELWEEKEVKEGCLHLIWPICRDRRANEITQYASFLVKNGASLEVRDSLGRTPLLRDLDTDTLATTRLKTLRVLLQGGAKADAVDNRGDGALHHALAACHDMLDSQLEKDITECLQLLLEHGCDPYLVNNHGYTPSDFALEGHVWPIWCSVVECATKYKMEDLLKADEISKKKNEERQQASPCKGKKDAKSHQEVNGGGDRHKETSSGRWKEGPGFNPNSRPEHPSHWLYHKICQPPRPPTIKKTRWMPKPCCALRASLAWCRQCNELLLPRNLADIKTEALKAYRRSVG